MPNKPTNYPYAQAAGAYDQSAQSHTPDQRELEGRVLLKAAKMIVDIDQQFILLARQHDIS